MKALRTMVDGLVMGIALLWRAALIMLVWSVILNCLRVSSPVVPWPIVQATGVILIFATIAGGMHWHAKG